MDLNYFNYLGLKSVFRDSKGFPILNQLLGSSDEVLRKSAVRFVGDLITKNRSKDNSEYYFESLINILQLTIQKASFSLLELVPSSS